MPRLNSADAVKVRRSADGTVWLHFPCPLCPARCLGPDHGAHLGIGRTTSGATFLRCFRCGASGSLRANGIGLDGAAPTDGRAFDQPRRPTAPSLPLPFLSLPLTSLLREYLEAKRRTEGTWRGLTWDDLASAGAEVDPADSETVVLPYVGYRLVPVLEEGHQFRRMGREPKVKTFGPRGPGFIRGRLPDRETDVVVVEGWADAVAVPFPFVGLSLMGTGNARHVDLHAFPHRRLYLATDGDAPGRAACRELARRALLERQECRLVPLPKDADPADLGPVEFSRLLKQATPCTRLEDLTAIDRAVDSGPSP